MEGYIYIMTNASMPKLLKIGCTTRSPELRKRELSSSSAIPEAFQVVYEIFSPKMKILEEKIHSALSKYRVNNKREFFKCDLNKAIQTIHRLANEIILEVSYHTKGINETFEAYEAIEILGDIKKKFIGLVPEDIISVRIYQTRIRCYLEITKENFYHQHDYAYAPLADQIIHRTDLGFITGEKDSLESYMFDPSVPVAQNARIFIEDFDLIDIANCSSDLLIEKAYDNLYKKIIMN